jgi:hypothetical protein
MLNPNPTLKINSYHTLTPNPGIPGFFRFFPKNTYLGAKRHAQSDSNVKTQFRDGDSCNSSVGRATWDNTLHREKSACSPTTGAPGGVRNRGRPHRRRGRRPECSARRVRRERGASTRQTFSDFFELCFTPSPGTLAHINEGRIIYFLFFMYTPDSVRSDLFLLEKREWRTWGYYWRLAHRRLLQRELLPADISISFLWKSLVR